MSDEFIDILSYYKDIKESNKFGFLNIYKNKESFGPLQPSEIFKFKKNKDLKTCIVDDFNTYNINMQGFREKNFGEKCEILAVGCSVTFGTGIPEIGRWSNILESKTKKSVINLSRPGGSISALVLDTIKYLKKYNKPDYILMLAPSLTRMNIVEDGIIYKSGKWQYEDKKEKPRNSSLRFVSSDLNIFLDFKNYKMFFLKNKNFNSDKLENILSPYQAIHESLNHIFILENFCRVNNIRLVWTTWSNSSRFLLKELSKNNDFFLDTDSYKVFDDIIDYSHDYNDSVKDCKKDHNTDFINHRNWTVASDFVYVNGKISKDHMSHPGIHFNYHVAEFFEKFL